MGSQADDALIEAVPIALARVGADGRIAAANALATALLGAGRVGLHHVTALRQPAALEAVQAALGGRGASPRPARAPWAGPAEGEWRLTATPLPSGALLAFEDLSAGTAVGRPSRTMRSTWSSATP
ncbi:MAG: hypothetical protein ACU0BS_05160, partial [Hasllibacter sp.]